MPALSASPLEFLVGCILFWFVIGAPLPLVRHDPKRLPAS